MAAIQRGRILDVQGVEEKAGISLSTIRRMMKERKFPKPVQLSKRRQGWKESDIDLWIAERA